MAKQNINVGTKANDKAGDPLRTAFTKINDNFTELYTLTGGTSTALTELAQDYAAPLFNHASHTNITATYDDANNKILLTGVAAQVQSNWNASNGLGQILNKPTIPTSFSSLVNGDNTVSLGTDGVLTLPGILKIDDGVHEKFQTKADATGIVTHDCSLGHIFYHTSPDALFAANFTNLNLSSGYATALTLIIEQGGTGFIPNNVGIGGALQTINWQGNVTPTPSTNRTDVVTFSIINVSGTYTVLGQLTGF